MSGSIGISGIQEAQRANVRAIAALKPGSAFGRALQIATMAAHRYAVGVTHVQTGALRGSHRMEMEGGGLRGRVYIDPASVNPRTGDRPAEYGLAEHARGGSHAFYERTVREYGDDIAEQAFKILLRGLP